MNKRTEVYIDEKTVKQIIDRFGDGSYIGLVGYKVKGFSAKKPKDNKLISKNGIIKDSRNKLIKKTKDGGIYHLGAKVKTLGDIKNKYGLDFLEEEEAMEIADYLEKNGHSSLARLCRMATETTKPKKEKCECDCDCHYTDKEDKVCGRELEDGECAYCLEFCKNKRYNTPPQKVEKFEHLHLSIP